MSDLKLSTTIGGNTIWSAGNLPVLPNGDDLFYKGFKLYSTFNKPTKADVGLGNVPNYRAAVQSEAEAGTSDTLLMTPLKTNQYFNAKTTTFSRNLLTDNTDSAMRTRLGVYSKTESDDKYALDTRIITAGDGLSGGGTLEANRTISVDSSVVRLTATQTLTNKVLTAPISSETKLQNNVHFNDIDDDTIDSGLLAYVRDGVWTIRTNTGEAVTTASIDIDGSVTAGSFVGNGSNLTNLSTDNLSGTISYTNLPFGSTDVSQWGTAYDRSLTTISGNGNSNIILTRQDGSTYTTNLAHTHSAGDITSGVLSSSRIPTITTSMVNFANQSLNTSSRPFFSGLDSNGDVDIVKDNAWLTLDSSSSGSDSGEQGAGISIGESGKKGSASLHLTYTGNGRGHIGMGSVGSTGIPSNEVLELYYTSRIADFKATPTVNGSQVYHVGHKPTYAELGTITTSMTNFTNQYLYTNSSPTFNQLDIDGRIHYNAGNDWISLDARWGVGGTPSDAGILHINGTNGAGGTYGHSGIALYDGGSYHYFWARDSAWTRHTTNSGYIDFGPANTSAAHIYSDRPRFYFNKPLSATSFQVTSDRNLKENIKEYSPKSNESIKLVQWDWKDVDDVLEDKRNTHDTGVIAQDVEKVFPTCVDTGTDGIKSVDYGKFATHHSIRLQERLERLERRTIYGITKTLINKIKRLLHK